MAVAPLNCFFCSAAVLSPTFDIRRIHSLYPVNDPIVDILVGWGKPSRLIIFILIRVGARVSCGVLSATRNLGLGPKAVILESTLTNEHPVAVDSLPSHVLHVMSRG